MKKTITLLFVVCFSVTAVRSQAPQEPKPKVIIQTPFGPKEIDAEPGQQPAQSAPVAPAPPAPGAQGNITAAPAVPTAPAPPAGGQLAQPAPVQSAAVQGDDPLVNFGLVFDNQDIYGVIKVIFDQLGVNYVIDPSIRGTVNIHTNAGSLRRSEVLQILETILKINGATMIRTGNFYEIVPANAAIRQPLPIQERSATVAFDDQMTIQIVRMRYVSAAEMSRLLNPYMSEGANIVAYEAGNILLISERRSNLRKLLEIIDIFDTNAFEGERVRLFPVKNTLAKDLIGDLRTIFAGYAFSETSSAIRFVAMDRINSVLVITPNSAVFAEVEKWLDRLDQPVATAGIRNYVYNVNNGRASDIQAVIAELYGTRVQVSNVYQPPAGTVPGQPTGTPQQPASPFSVPGASQSNAGGQAGTAISQTGSLRIIADEIKNALVIQATPQLYAVVEQTIRELDTLPRQVLVDAQIYEVTLDNSISFGLNAALQNRGTLSANPQTTASFVTPSGGTPSLVGQTFAFVGRARELALFLNASENRSRVRTLSAPSVLVSDNMQADFTVGAEIPVPTTSSITPVQSGGTNLFAQTISFRPTGVILKVRPQINTSGNITLQISQEVSQAAANTTSGVVAPVIGKSAINSTVVVQDGQTIALGGFIRENNELARSRIPLLGRIPGAGALFGNTRNGTTRTELIVLLTPHVLLTHEDADLATDELKSKLKEVEKLLK